MLLSKGRWHPERTTVAINKSSKCEWHIDTNDIELTALLYFGDFRGGELKLGQPFNIEVPLENGDLQFLRSSKVYHKSVQFSCDRVNIIFYTGLIRKEVLVPCIELM